MAEGSWSCGRTARSNGSISCDRGLVTAFLQSGPVMVIPGIQGAGVCRWCGRGVAPHHVRGWVHQHDGLIVCNLDGEGVTVAEPQ